MSQERSGSYPRRAIRRLPSLNPKVSAPHSLVGVAPSVVAHTAPAPRLPWKRPLDVVLAGLGLLLGLPVLALCIVLVRLDSPGPALFGQERVGRFGRPFTIWKLRSMRDGAANDFHRAATSAWFRGEPLPNGYKPDGDPRVTRVGRFLRRTCLDELPQLFNVLKGEMSLVGPRPAIPYELALYEPWYFHRLGVAPGITGLWQISGRDGLSAAAMMRLDVRYVRHASLGLDVRILARTAVIIIRRLAGRTDGWH